MLNVWSKSRRRRWWGERPSEVLPDSGATDETDDVSLRHDIQRALGRLGAEHRQVLVQRFVADLSETQVADVLRVPLGTVKSRTARAISLVDPADLREEL